MTQIKLISLVVLVTVFVTGNAQLNCLSIANATSNLNSYSCNCNGGYLWNGLSCRIDCSSISGSNGTAKSLTSCFCLSGSVWSGGSCNLNCALIANTLSSNGTNACTCVSGYTWTNGKCTVNVNCSSIANSNGINSDGSCGCNSGY